jgi:hypothetical protein
MRTATSLRRLSLLVAAAFGLLASGASAQSELMVAPGPGTLNDAIENDTARPADRVYVLQREAYYGVTREINNQGFTLRIKAADGDGNRPVIYPAPDSDGNTPGSRYFNLAGDTYFTGIYFLGVDPSQGEVATAFALNDPGMRFVVDDCVFQGGRSRLIEVNVDDTDLFFTNSQFRNLVRNDGSSNGRPIDYRTVRGDSLVVTNTSFLNISGYIVRYDGPVLNTAIFDHNTFYVTGRELTTNAFATQTINFRFTNNLVVNPYGFGQAPEAEEDLDGVVQFDSLDVDIDNGFAESDRSAVIMNNGYMITDDLQAYYDARTASMDSLQAYLLLDTNVRNYAEADSMQTVLMVADNETYDLNFVNPPDLSDYIAYLGAFRDGAADPGYWTFGSDTYFPADQPPPEDLAYSTSSPAYTAGQGGFPLGDLTYFPDQLAAWEEAGGLSVAEEGAPEADGFVLHGAAPNPSAGATTLRMSLDAAAVISVDVFDTLGRRVLSVPAAAVPAGTGHSVRLDAPLPSGVYVARVAAEAAGGVRVRTTRFTVAR